ncbi:uncharacterized protein stbd1 [Pygocentrus nattereri]|uniref:Starch-binding domain-containing protein 1 n=1 Tax=Pygocentrus nattereri TaxID=42514 RepID=A0AAR2LX57_PYGNA|nr:uncharacterized protein stbd1 [Pygocentrus nattereri]
MLSVVSSAAMLGEKPASSASSASFAPDPRSPSGWMGGSGAAVLALCMFVAALCAGAAFLLYRAVRGRFGGDTKDAAGEKQHRAFDSTESTEVSDEGGSEECETDSSEAVILSTANHAKISTGLPEEDLRETTIKNLNEPTEDLQPGLVTRDDTRETNGTQYSECYKREGDTAEIVKVEADLFDYQHEGSTRVEDSLKERVPDVEEFETELHGDVDEPSETESAQETLEAKNVPVHKCQSVEDLLDNTLLAPDVATKPSKTELAVPEPEFLSSTTEADHKATKTEDEEAFKKGFEDNVERLFPQVSEFDLCCYDEQSHLLSCNLVSDKTDSMRDEVQRQQDFGSSSNSLGNAVQNSRYDPSNSRYNPVLDHPQQSYLGFTTSSLRSDSTGQVQLPDASRERSVVTVGCSVSAPVETSLDKNEINIMEAIMDSNEWLSTGPPDTRELPWLTQAQSNTGYGFKTNTSLVPPVTSNATDISWLKPAPASTSHGPVAEESQSPQEKTEGFVVAPEDTVVGVANDEEDFLNKKVAAVSPMPQMVRVSFRVHYVTHSPSQLLAVTGSQQELGAWESFFPLQRVEDWFWANTITLPTENQVEWKFVLVEDGKIRRWEECGNRHLLVMGQEEEIRLDKCWGYM